MDPATIKLLKVVELKEALKSLGLSTKGRKAELQARLLEYHAAEQRGEKTPSPELLATGETSSEAVTGETTTEDLSVEKRDDIAENEKSEPE